MKTENFIKKINEVKEKNELDISILEDLSVGLMNLVSLEEHCFFSYAKTKDNKFLNMLDTVRELRKKLMLLIVKKDDSEKWCMSKHFLASSMRLFEIGNRLLHECKEKEAKEMYHDAAELYGMFWALNSGSEKVEISNGIEEKKGIFSSIKKFLECCNE